MFAYVKETPKVIIAWIRWKFISPSCNNTDTNNSGLMCLFCSSHPTTQAASIFLSLGHRPPPHDAPPLPHCMPEDEETEAESVHVSPPLLLVKAWFKLLYRVGAEIKQLRQQLFSLSRNSSGQGAGSVPCDNQGSRPAGRLLCRPLHRASISGSRELL